MQNPWQRLNLRTRASHINSSASAVITLLVFLNCGSFQARLAVSLALMLAESCPEIGAIIHADQFEVWGEATFIVFDDSDPELVAAKASLAAIMNTGQDCTAATRLYVEKSKLKVMQDAVVEAMKGIKVGSPFDDGVQMGPLISGVQRERVSGFVDRSKAEGAKILTGGGVPKGFDKGYYYEPTVITNVKQDSEIVQNEVFGPVITVQEFTDEAQALAFGNDVLYGLAASVFTKDIGRAMRLSSQLEFGTVWINDHLPLTSETPHGGFKQSGFGKDLSAEAIGDYQITKHVKIAQ